MCELEFIAKQDFDDPWRQLQVDFEFIDPDGTQRIVPAFWAGGRSWRVATAHPLKALIDTVLRSEASGNVGSRTLAGRFPSWATTV